MNNGYDNNYETKIYTYEKKTKKGKTARFSVKFNKLAFGLLLIACAVFIILDSVGVSLGFLSGIPAITLVIGALLIVWTLTELIKLRISGIFFPLAFLFMLFEKYIAKWAALDNENIINNWLVLLAAALLSIGCSLIIPKRKTFTYVKSSSNTTGSNSKQNTSSLSSSTIYIDCSTFENESVVNELGACQVFFSNIEQYDGNGVLNVVNELGSMKINVPSTWKIITSISNELGSVNEPSETDGDKVIRIVGSNELGSMTITQV